MDQPSPPDELWEPLPEDEEEEEWNPAGHEAAPAVPAWRMPPTQGRTPTHANAGVGRSDDGSTASRSSSHQQATASGRILTRDMVLRSLKTSRQSEATSLDKQLLKATHLHLQDLHLGQLGTALQGLPHLETLYLFDNLLTDPVGLSGLSRLICLNLQNNRLTSLTALDSLHQLQKLYVQGNHLSEIDGLYNLMELEELHVSNQRPPQQQQQEQGAQGGGLRFNAACMASLAPTLRVLCALDCGIQDESLEALQGLNELRKLDLGQNSLTSFDDLEEVVRGAPSLITLDLQGNPMCRQPKYHESIIVMSDRMQVLDGQPVSAKQREVLMRLQIKRMKAQLAAEQAAAAPAAPGGKPRSAPHMDSMQVQQPPGGARAHAAPGALPSHGLQRPAAAPPVAAGFGQPRHLAHQVSGSSRHKGAVPSIPQQGDMDGLMLGMQGVQLNPRRPV